MPDTDALFGQPDDGETLTGPVAIRVQALGDTVALIDALQLPGTTLQDDLFPHFVALPAPNQVEAVVGQVGRVLATSDTAGNLFVPLDFRAYVREPDPGLDRVVPTQFIEADVPGLQALGAKRWSSPSPPRGAACLRS